MSRKRYDGLKVQLGGSGLSSSDTTITFAAPLTYLGSSAVAVPTLGANDHLPLSLLDADGLCTEIVWLTAYTVGATTGTIARGKETTTGVAHSVGALAVCAGTACDMARAGYRFDNPDDPLWGPSLGYDLEFEVDDTSGTLPSGWSWVNQGGSTYRQAWGAAIITPEGMGLGSANRLLVRSMPSESTWKYTIKMPSIGTHSNWERSGMIVRRASTGKFTFWGRTFGASGWPNDVTINDWNDANTFGGGEGHDSAYPGVNYYRIEKKAGPVYDYSVSYDGLSWAKVIANRSPYDTFDQIGLMVSSYDAVNPYSEIAYHWLRVR